MQSDDICLEEGNEGEHVSVSNLHDPVIENHSSNQVQIPAQIHSPMPDEIEVQESAQKSSTGKKEENKKLQIDQIQ